MFECTICNVKLTRKDNLKRHIETIHQNTSPIEQNLTSIEQNASSNAVKGNFHVQSISSIVCACVCIYNLVFLLYNICNNLINLYLFYFNYRKQK